MSVTYVPLPETRVTDAGNKLPPALQKLVIETSKQSAGQICITVSFFPPMTKIKHDEKIAINAKLSVIL